MSVIEEEGIVIVPSLLDDSWSVYHLLPCYSLINLCMNVYLFMIIRFVFCVSMYIVLYNMRIRLCILCINAFTYVYVN